MPTAAERIEIVDTASGRPYDAAVSVADETMTSPKCAAATGWSYDEAFSRNLGLISREEQQILRHSRIAIAGMGGVGGVHLLTLARLGIGRFTIADPDRFELANFNRQAGANTTTVGRGKVEVMAEQVRQINPEAEVRVINGPIGASNIEAFFDSANVFIDGVDFFAIDIRRRLFQEARRRGLWGITAGPHAFSTGWITFSPNGMSFDEFFDMHDRMDATDLLVAFCVGIVPKPLHLRYVNLSEYFNPSGGKGASVGLACQLASGVVAAQISKILLARDGMHPAPWYFQFDAYLERLCRKKLRWGNRGPWQRIKRAWLRSKILNAQKNGVNSSSGSER